MSYEGYSEHLCGEGHYTATGAYYFEEGCPCGKPFVFSHSVDQTNGVEYDEEEVPLPSTIPYPFKGDGFTDIWKKDHYGNKYALKRLKFKIPKKA